jgi:hypothetical protein
VLIDPDFGAFIDRVAEDPTLATADSVKEVFGKIEAMTMESSDKVTVKLK